jgi:N-acyl-D-aspartate/D-glutamate deacylase
MTCDAIIAGGLWFDGTGAAPARRDLGIRDGHVVEVSAEPLDPRSGRAASCAPARRRPPYG